MPWGDYGDSEGEAGMFTGLVRAVGHVERCATGVRLRLPASGDGEAWSGGEGLGHLFLGDSVAVDGVCLTVAECFSDGFRADVSEETLARTTLAAKAEARAAVNLEPALRLSDRLGGHLVSGHVDGLGTVVAIAREPASWRLEVRWNDPAYGRYVCEKASVAIDGISLTVAGCSTAGQFWIAVIPHTWSATTLAHRRVGDVVNLEADLLAKYTERLLQVSIGAGGLASPSQAGEGMSRDWLSNHGWA
jgi:riboflavin synthase